MTRNDSVGGKSRLVLRLTHDSIAERVELAAETRLARSGKKRERSSSLVAGKRKKKKKKTDKPTVSLD